MIGISGRDRREIHNSPYNLPKNQQFATLKDLPKVSVPSSDFIQGPRYDMRSQIESNLKFLQLQEEELRKKRAQEQAEKLRETQDMLKQVKSFKQEQSAYQRNRRFQHQELHSFHKDQSKSKELLKESLKQEKDRDDERRMAQASKAIASEREELIRKQLELKGITKQNLEEARARKQSQELKDQKFQEEVRQLQQEHSQKEIKREEYYEQMMTNIQNTQKLRQKRFEEMFILPSINRQRKIDEAISRDMLKTFDHSYKIEHDLTFIESASKFFGVEYNEMSRLGKNVVKTKSHDPITGSNKTYNRNLSPVRPLGKSQNETLSGKISDSPTTPHIYKLPEYRKKAPRFTSFNPLIHQAFNYGHIDSNSYASAMKHSNFSHKHLPFENIQYEQPIYKGKGYKRSSIFY